MITNFFKSQGITEEKLKEVSIQLQSPLLKELKGKNITSIKLFSEETLLRIKDSQKKFLFK